MSKNTIDLLIALGVNDAKSRRNINDYISKLHGLDKVEVELDVKDNSGDAVSKYEARIKKLEQTISRLNAEIGKMNTSGKGGMGDTFGGLNRTIDASNKALESLRKSVHSANGEMSVMYDGNNKLLGVVTKIKDEMGNLNTVRYKPNFDASGLISGFTEIKTIIKDIQGKDLSINKSDTLKQLDALKKQINLVGVEYDEYKKKIEKVTSNDGLKAIIKDLKELESRSKMDFKLFEGIDKVQSELRAVEAQMERIAKKNGNRANTTALNSAKEQMTIISNKDITSLQDVQKSLIDIARLKQQVSAIRVEAGDNKSFESGLERAKKSLRDMQNSTREADSVVEKLTRRLSSIPSGDLNQLEKVMQRIKVSAEALSNRITMKDGIAQAEANIKKLRAEVERYYELNKKYVKKSDYEAIMGQIDVYANLPRKSVADIKDLARAYKDVNAEVKKFGTLTTQASRNSMTLVNALKVAMERFPLWMVSSTLFYGSIRSAKELVDILVDIDTKMVSIQKIAGDTNIEETFERASNSAQTFGQSISQALDAYIEFSRQGYKGNDLEILGNAGLVTANVGEISSQAGAEYLTSALVQWNKETTEAMGIIDSWNEISNNFATTVEKLAQGQTRAGAVAKAVGLEFDQLNALIGTLTATTKQSGSEIGNFIKAVIPRLTSKPAQNALKSLNVSLTDDAGNLRDIVEVYREVAIAVQGISESERLAVTEGLAGKYHISRMQALLDDLSKADSMYDSMYQSSTNSAGSAMRENEIYMQSLQAKINLVRVEFEQLAVAIGKAFLTDGMLAFMKMMSKTIQGITTLVEKVGALPIAFGVLGGAIILLSRRARNLVTEMVMLGGVFRKGVVESRTLAGGIGAVTVATNTATVGVNLLKNAWRGFLASTGVGLLLAGIGFGLEFLVNKMGEASEKTEELEVSTTEIANAYKSNAQELRILADEYATLDKKMKTSGLSDEEMTKYLDTANQIGTIMPSLAEGEDLYGRKIVGSAEALQTRIGILEEQARLEEKIAQDEARNKRVEDIKTYNASIDESTQKIKVLTSAVEIYQSQNLRNAKEFGVPKDMIINLVDENGKDVVQNMETLLDMIELLKSRMDDARSNGDEGLLQYYEKLYDNMQWTYNAIAPHENNMKKAMNSLKLTYIDSVNAMIKANEGLSDSTKQAMSDFSMALLSASSNEDIESLAKSLETIFSDSNLTGATSGLMTQISDLRKASSESFGEMKKDIENSLKTLPEMLTKSGMKGKDAEKVFKSLEKAFKDVVAENARLEKQSKATGVSVNLLSAYAEEAGDSASEWAKEIKQVTDVYEELAGVTQKQIDTTNDLLFQYEMLTSRLGGLTDQQLADLAGKTDLTSHEKMLVDIYRDRQGVMKDLNSLYPELLGQDGKAISLSSEKVRAIEIENKANENLLKAYKLLRDGKLDAEAKMTIASMEGAKFRIGELQKEIKALVISAKVMSVVARMANKVGGGIVADAQSKVIDEQIKAREAEIADLLTQIDGMNGTLEKYVSSAEASEKATKSQSKATKESTYQTDQYKQALEALSVVMEKQRKITASFPKHSQEYRDSLQKEMNLLNQKSNLMRAQSKILEGQAKTTVDQMTAQSGAMKTENRKLAGWNGRITSTFGSRADNHRGVDIAMARGSRLESNVSGTVIKSGWATNSDNGKAMHKSYGNMVVIQGEDGLKHIYAHLDKAVAKLGETVKVGQYIGNIGSTGNSTGSHLHYEQNNASGGVVNPTSTVNAVRGGTFNVTGGTGDVQQKIDQAKSDMAQIEKELIGNDEELAEMRKRMVESWVDWYEEKKTNYDKFIENSDNRLKRLNSTTEDYRKELDKQTKALVDKKKVNQDEIAYLKWAIENMNLSKDSAYQMTQSLHDLGKANSEIDFAIWEIGEQKMQSMNDLVSSISEDYIDLLDKNANQYANLEVELKGLDKSSKEYYNTLIGMNKSLREKQLLNQEELTKQSALIQNGKLYGEALENARKKVDELQLSVKELVNQIEDSNFEIIVSVKNQSDDIVKDIQFEIDKASKSREKYDQGSEDYRKYTDTLVKQYEKLAQQHLKTRDALTEEIKLRGTSAERIKEIKQLLRDEHLAYIDATLAIKNHNKELEEANKAQIEKLWNDLVNLYKEVVSARRDAHMKEIQERIDSEAKAHESRIKQLNDEMNLFRKNVQERLKLIEREEAQRTYDMKIDDLEKERNKLQKLYDKMANVTSADDKKKRKEILEKMNEIDKQIAEEQHQRSIELQKQGLNDLLDIKQEETDGKIEEEKRSHDETIKLINREKEYWEKHYTDLLNDQRKFNQMREDLINGHFDKIKAEFEGYIGEMEAMMPNLLDTLDGTMSAVGGSIQQNLIDNLREALKLMQEISDTKIADANGIPDWVPNIEDYTSSPNASGKLTSGDLDILLGKFLTDVVANKLTGQAKTDAHYKGNIYGKAGRDKDGTIASNISFDSALAGLSQSQRQQVMEYFRSQSGLNGGAYQSYFDQLLGTGQVGGTTDQPSNNASRYGIGASLSRGDTQVLMAKYINDNLRMQTGDPSLQTALKNTADKIAENGRNNGSKIATNVGYDEILRVLNNAQKTQLRSYMTQYSNTITDPILNSYLKRHIASLDTGGLTGNWSDLGIDGRRGKVGILHPNEVTLDDGRTDRFFDAIDAQDRIMRGVNSLFGSLNPQNVLSGMSQNSGVTYEILITGNNIQANNEDQLKDMARTINKHIDTTRGG